MMRNDIKDLEFDEWNLNFFEPEHYEEVDGRPSVGNPDLLLLRLKAVFGESRLDLPPRLAGFVDGGAQTR
jgi:hypothetical protein